MAEMAILQEMDKCMKCRGCQVACERSQNLQTTVGNADKIQADDPMVVKAQGKNDCPPYVRYSCWHCVNPPCASACPKGAMLVNPDTKAVYVDQTKCVPTACAQECVKNCRKGGYPKVGTNTPGTFAYKCDMCNGRLVNGKPACVATCPGGALSYRTLASITTPITGYLATNYSGTGDVWIGEGHMFWARKSPGGGAVASFDPPTTDPYIEDHISPMFNKVLKSPVGAALAVPALLLGGLLAFFKRRETLSEINET